MRNIDQSEYIDVMTAGQSSNSGVSSESDPFRYTKDADYVAEIEELYGKVLDKAGVNVTDSLMTSMKFFNRFGDRPGLDPPKGSKSYIFMTRPDLNFSNPANNIQVPYFDFMEQSELGRMLMGLLQYPGRSIAKGTYHLNSNFHPLITNLATESGGGKDLVMEKYDIDANLRGDQLSYAAGADGIFSIGELPITFTDAINSPIFHTMVLWFLYIHHVARGDISPKRINIVQRIIDYSCSFYIFIVGPDGKTITRFAKYTGCFPISVPMSSIQHMREMNIEALKEVQVTFAYNRYEPMNPEIFTDFNLVSSEFLLKGGVKEYLDINKSTFDINKIKFPDPIIETDKTNPEDLADYPWASHPFIVGNQLLFF